MNAITQNTVLEVNIPFFRYLLERMDIASVRENGTEIEETHTSWSSCRFATVEGWTDKNILVSKLVDIEHSFLGIKYTKKEWGKVVEVREVKVFGPIFLEISQEAERGKNSRHTLHVEITVFEGDEKDKYEHLYQQIADHAETYVDLYNSIIPDWITATITRSISLKRKL